MHSVSSCEDLPSRVSFSNHHHADKAPLSPTRQGKRASWERAMLALLGMMSCAVFHAVAGETLIPNGGFEEGVQGWQTWMSAESTGKGCQFDVVSEAPHSGANCARLQTDDFARFCIGSGVIPVQPGERYRVSVWVRADPAAKVQPKAPGFVIRLNLRQGDQDAEGGHLFIGPGNTVARNTPPDSPSELPAEWTRIEAVVEIPGGVDAMIPSLFSWWTKGAIFADDFSIEKVDASTPVTPLQ